MQLEDLLLHPQTKRNISLFINRPVHALLLSGPAGSGKTTLARITAARLLQLDSAKELEKYPFYDQLAVAEGKQDIPIEEVRRVIKMMGLKVPGKQSVRRVVFIQDANNLSLPAQNAILKILEEPSLDTVFILSAASPLSVLPTIASRAQQIAVQPVSLPPALAYFKGRYAEDFIKSAWQLSQGRAGLLQALLADDSKHPLKNAVLDAKNFHRQKPYERLLALDKLSRDKQALKLFLEALERSLAELHRLSIQAGRQNQASKLLSSRKLARRANNALEDNVNPRLITIDVALNLNI